MARLAQWLLALALLCSAGLLAIGLLPREAGPLPPPPANDPATPDPTGDGTVQTPSPAMATRPPLDHFQAVVARPLFFPSRRPPPPITREERKKKASTRAGKPAEKPPFSVMGIIIDGDLKVALIKPVVRDGEVMRIKEGEVVKGWTVSRIAADRVAVRRDDTESLVRLSDNLLSPDQKRQLKQRAAQDRARERKAAKQQTRRTPRNGSKRRQPSTPAASKTGKRRRVIPGQNGSRTPIKRQPARGQPR